MHAHAVVWIDHHQARIISFHREASDQSVVHAHNRKSHLHTKAGSHEGYRAAEDISFFQSVADRLTGVQALLVCGPAGAKTEFAEYLRRHAPGLAKSLTEIIAMDKVTDGELLSAARLHFKRTDRLQPQAGAA